MNIDFTERELELIHFCVHKETPLKPIAPEDFELADIEARLATILCESDVYHQ